MEDRNMTGASGTSSRDEFPSHRDQMWSRSEKTIAHKVFDAALNQELHEVMEQARLMASKISRPQEIVGP
jgi:hypothetical protein